MINDSPLLEVAVWEKADSLSAENDKVVAAHELSINSQNQDSSQDIQSKEEQSQVVVDNAWESVSRSVVAEIIENSHVSDNSKSSANPSNQTSNEAEGCEEESKLQEGSIPSSSNSHRPNNHSPSVSPSTVIRKLSKLPVAPPSVHNIFDKLQKQIIEKTNEEFKTEGEFINSMHINEVAKNIAGQDLGVSSSGSSVIFGQNTSKEDEIDNWEEWQRTPEANIPEIDKTDQEQNDKE